MGPQGLGGIQDSTVHYFGLVRAIRMVMGEGYRVPNAARELEYCGALIPVRFEVH